MLIHPRAVAPSRSLTSCTLLCVFASLSVLGCGGGAPSSRDPSRHTALDPISLLPPDTQAVLDVDVATVRNAPFMVRVDEVLEPVMDSQAASVRDLINRIDRVALAFLHEAASDGSEDLLIVARGRFSAADLETFAASQTPGTHREHALRRGARPVVQPPLLGPAARVDEATVADEGEDAGPDPLLRKGDERHLVPHRVVVLHRPQEPHHALLLQVLHRHGLADTGEPLRHRADIGVVRRHEALPRGRITALVVAHKERVLLFSRAAGEAPSVHQGSPAGALGAGAPDSSGDPSAASRGSEEGASAGAAPVAVRSQPPMRRMCSVPCFRTVALPPRCPTSLAVAAVKQPFRPPRARRRAEARPPFAEMLFRASGVRLAKPDCELPMPRS